MTRPMVGYHKIVESIVFSFSNHHRLNAAMLVPHRLKVISDGPSLFHEQEGLSMLKSPRWLPAVAGVKRTSVMYQSVDQNMGSVSR